MRGIYICNFHVEATTVSRQASDGYGMVIDQFQQRLFEKIDQEIAEAERLLQLQPRSSAADEQAEASYERLQQFVVKMRERRRRARRQFLAREQSFTDSAGASIAVRCS